MQSIHGRLHCLFRIFLVCCATIAFDESAFTQETSVPYGNGARTFRQMQGFVHDRDQFAKQGHLFRIEGGCQSACTIFLKLRNVCIDPNAELLFHAANNPRSTAIMLASYNSRLRRFLMENHYMDTPQFHTISGRQMIQQFGYRQCPST